MKQSTLDKIAHLHPKLRYDVTMAVTNCANRGVDIIIPQGLRTFQEQNNIYAQGRTQEILNAVGLNTTIAMPLLKNVSNAYGGQSYHNYGLALDFCLVHKDGSISWDLKEDMDKDKVSDWMEVVEEFEKLNFSWGGHWKKADNPHFEKTFGYNFRTLMDMVKAGKVDKEGYVLL